MLFSRLEEAHAGCLIETKEGMSTSDPIRGSGKEATAVPAVNEVYVCERCGLEVQVLKAGHCIPQCCGQEMRPKT